MPGDIYLIRAVPGVYNQGDPLYATQRDNGIYVSRRGEGRFLGWAKESVIIREEDVDIVDERIGNPEPEAITMTCTKKSGLSNSQSAFHFNS